MIILQDQVLEAREPRVVAGSLQRWIASLDAVDRAKEHFFVVLVNSRAKIQFVDVVSVGTLNASLIHPREIFIRAVREAANSILIAHNHPSGACDPSNADITITKRLREVGKIIGIELLDHLIIATDGYYSFCEAGML